jgi:hypothetical protein
MVLKMGDEAPAGPIDRRGSCSAADSIVNRLAAAGQLAMGYGLG